MIGHSPGLVHVFCLNADKLWPIKKILIAYENKTSIVHNY
jgi:hypothetical protein